jgi:hypothetical protein
MALSVDRSAPPPWFLAIAGAIALTGVLPVPGALAPNSTAPLDLPTSTARLVVDPAVWWMPAGNETTFRATWVDPDPECALLPLWYRWSLPSAPAGGVLGPGAGAEVNFTAETVVTGVASLLVRGTAFLQCGSAGSAVLSSAAANVTVAAPLDIQNLSLTPNPILPGATAYLRGNLTGGAPPYTFWVAWGDGTRSVASATVPGPFAVPHRFGTGQYAPTLTVNDSSGLVAQGTVEEPLVATTALAVAIAPERLSTDVNVSLSLRATVVHASGPVGTGWSCGNAADIASEASGDGATFACAFASPGTGQVTFEAYPAPPAPPARAVLEESVTPDPELELRTPNVTAEVGVPVSVGYVVLHGVPPYILEWDLTGGDASGRFELPSAGSVLLPVVPTESGALSLVARLVDADGVMTVNTSATLEVEAPLSLEVAVASSPNGTGTQVGVLGTVIGGSPPFSWAVLPEIAPPNSTAVAGSLAAAGSFRWSSYYALEGAVPATIVALDASGAFVATALSLPGLPALTAFFNATGAPAPGEVEITGSVAGGAPPFSLRLEGSDGETWGRSLTTDGSLDWNVTTSASGSLGLRLTIRDALGAEAFWNGTTRVDAAPFNVGGELAALSALLVTAVTVPLAGAVLFFVARRRRQRTGADRPPPDAVATLREIIAPADGADRATVELLAEEAGVPLSEVRATLDRLIADGKVRSDAEGDDGEVVSWATDRDA